MISRKGREVDRETFVREKVWKCIRDVQCSRKGLVPSRPVTIYDEDGMLCVRYNCIASALEKVL